MQFLDSLNQLHRPPEYTRFVALDTPPQLINHSLGMKNAHGKRGFRLLYLWCDVPGREAVKHADEIAEFSKSLNGTGSCSMTLMYQETILSLSRDWRVGHETFIDFLAERYL